jgi:hypothetical protein
MMLRARFFHHEAIDVLHYNKLEPHNVLLLLTGPLHLSDRNGVVWTFIARRQTRAYLLAKHANMEQFKEVYSMGHSGEPLPMLDHRAYFKAGLLPISASSDTVRPGWVSYHDVPLRSSSVATTSVPSVATLSPEDIKKTVEDLKAARALKAAEANKTTEAVEEDLESEDLEAAEDLEASTEDLEAVEEGLESEDLKAVEDLKATEPSTEPSVFSVALQYISDLIPPENPESVAIMEEIGRKLAAI